MSGGGGGGGGGGLLETGSAWKNTSKSKGQNKV